MTGSGSAPVHLDKPLTWQAVAAVAGGSRMTLSSAVTARLEAARARVEAVVDRSIRAYGVNTGVGALCDTVVDRDHLRALSRNIVMSHAAGVGDPLGRIETRAIMATAINNWAHGASGVRPVLAERLLALLNADCVPAVPAQGSVGYLTHMAHVGLVVVGHGAVLGGESGAAALARLGLAPLVLDAKEGLSLVNGTPCATGLAALALARAERLLDWADAAAALSFEALGGDATCFDAATMALHGSPGLRGVAGRLRDALAGSLAVAVPGGGRTQEALSLRAVPQVHGAARDAFGYAGSVINRELASVTDNPLMLGSLEDPSAMSTAHAVGTGVALAADLLGIALAEVAAMAERRIDRLVNPLTSGLPAFLAAEGGSRSGFMIAQYTANSLVAENRRLAAPASLDGGVTSGLQEDHLSHATPASLKALRIIENGAFILGIELLAATAAGEMRGLALGRGTARVAAHVRAAVRPYADERPMADDIAATAGLINNAGPPV